jgi:hypothetical protein
MSSSSSLTKNDYIGILRFYGMPIPKSNRLLQKHAEKIMADKLCKCIKSVGKKLDDEKISIGICTKTIFNNKGYTRGKFKCLKKQSVNFRKTKKNRKK